MDNHFVIVLIIVVVVGTLLSSCQVDSYRTDFIPSSSSMPLTGAIRQLQQHQQQQQQGCMWSTLSSDSNGNNKNGTEPFLPPFLQQQRSRSFALNCNVRTLNVDFWSNYTFNRDQLEDTSRLSVKCNDKLFFESVLEPSQTFFRLRNLHDVSIQSCKIRKIPTRIWTGLSFLKSLTITSLNGEWSSAVGMDVEMGAFEGLTSLEKLDLSQNNIWAIHDKNIFCPLRSLLRLNMSRNKLSDLEEIGFSGSSTTSTSGSCVMNIQNLDLSHNSLRHLHPSAFNRLKRMSELRLQNNLIEELEDLAFHGLNQLRLVNISSNRLVALPPTVFKNNPTLREINLSNNSISALSPQVFSGLSTLLSLDLSQNQLTSQWIRDSIFSGLIRLVVLKLGGNQLQSIDSEVFRNLVNLQALHLDNNRIEYLNPSALITLKNLHSLDLSKNALSVIDSRHFSNLFLLRQLYLDHNRIREIDNDSLKNCTNLQDLGLADNQLTQVPVALRSGLSHLVTLDIGENRIETITNESFSGLGQLYGLRIVDNKINELGYGFCEPLTKLRVLNVAQNRISKISPGAFSACPELRALRLDTNALEELPTTLAPQLPSLLWLNVSQNQLTYADYHLLPQTIEWLDLSHNLIETLGGPVVDGGKDTIPYSLRVLDASHNKLSYLDYTTIAPTLETLRVNHNRIEQVAPDTFIRSSRLRRVELVGNKLENLPLSALRFPPVPSGKPLPEFFIGGNPFICSCSMEWLTRINQLSVVRQHPRIVDLDAIVCRGIRGGGLIPLVETKAKDFLCPYESHCFALCHCCDFDACDCAMKCDSKCSCYHDTAWSSNIVECSNSNFTDIPSKVPIDASELYLDGNVLTELRSHIFIGKKNLRVLYLNSSRVETIRNKTFNGLTSLEVLRLDSNLLEQIHGHEFADLTNLRELYLHNNKLTYISNDAFSRLSFLQVLRLDGNALLNFKSWELSNNKYLNSVMLANNKWSCDCEFLIPFRAWAASKNSIVVDFALTTCEPSPPSTVGSNDTVPLYGGDFQSPQLIINMCDHNKELNFNFNPNNNDNFPALLDSELLNSNHISAEKVASPPSSNNNDDGNTVPSNSGNINNNNNHYQHNNNNYPSINDISSAEETLEKDSGELWTVFLSVLITIIIVILAIAFLLFRKDCHSLLPLCLYKLKFPCASGNASDDEDNEDSDHHHGRPCFISSLFNCCCNGGGGGGKAGKKSGRAVGMDDADKLFDAYFLYSRKDEDLLAQKIAPELECPSGYSTAGTGIIPPPPPAHHHTGTPYYRLCLHYRDLCLSAENPLNTDMVLSACDASKRVFLVISRHFLQNELSHPAFRSTIQTAIKRYQSKLIFILLPPFTEQSLLTIYPELKAGHFTTMTMTKGGDHALSHSNSSNSQITSLEWGDKNFWSKIKLILPTPTILTSSSSPSGLNSTSTISSTGSSAIFNMAPAYHHHHHPHHNNLINYNNSMSLHEYAYNTINSQQNHQYHRNILPLNPPAVPKHHIALSTPAWQQQQQQQQLQNQNFYNNSQHSQIIPFPSGPPGVATPLMMQNAFNQPFNESFRRHLQLQQSQNKMTTSAPPHHHHQHHPSNCSSHHTGHHHYHHQHQGSHSSTHTTSTSNNPSSIPPYQPLDYSSSSNEELLDHVYSTLDSPPIMSGSTNNNNNNNGCESNNELVSKQINNNNNSSSSIDIGEQDSNNANHENSPSRVSPPPLQNRLNNNNTNNCPVANNTSGNTTPSNGTNNNGTMYFV